MLDCLLRCWVTRIEPVITLSFRVWDSILKRISTRQIIQRIRREHEAKISLQRTFSPRQFTRRMFFFSTLKRILAPLSPERPCNTITESKRHVHCFLHRDWFKATRETFRREKVEFASTFSSAHCESKSLKLRMLSSVSRRIR